MFILVASGYCDMFYYCIYYFMHLGSYKQWLVLFFIPAVGLGATTFAAAVPKWESLYNITGILYLPYAEVKEPFTAWYDGSKNRSRVDYYDST